MQSLTESVHFEAEGKLSPVFVALVVVSAIIDV